MLSRGCTSLSLGGLTFMIFTKKQSEFEQFGLLRLLKNAKKYVAEKYTRAHSPLARKYRNRIFESKDGTIVSLTIWRRDFFTKLQSYLITDL